MNLTIYLNNFKNIKWKTSEVLIFRFLTLLWTVTMTGAYIIIKNQYEQEAMSSWTLEMRLPLIGLFLLLFGLSFTKEFKEKYLSSAIVIIYYVITARVLLTAYGGHFRRETLVALILAIQIISVLMRNKKHLIFYLSILSIASAFLILKSTILESRDQNAILFLLFLFIIVNLVVNFFRIKTTEEKAQYLKQMEESKEKLEKMTTKLIGTNTKLARRNQELDKFSYLVSHDLKAPLRAINNLSTWIEEDLDGKMDEDTATNMGIMRGRVVRLENLIDGLLDYHGFGKTLAKFVEIKTKILVEHLKSIMKNGDGFDFEISEKMPTITARYSHVHEIFKQLIKNCIIHHPNKKGRIKIGYQNRIGFHYFYIEDDGIGIPEKYHEKVFTIFQTLQARDHFETIGVGLPIVKKIIELEGGNIWIDLAYKEGTKIWFTLPITPLEE